MSRPTLNEYFFYKKVRGHTIFQFYKVTETNKDVWNEVIFCTSTNGAKIGLDQFFPFLLLLLLFSSFFFLQRTVQTLVYKKMVHHLKT